jgi:thiamine biosynthesis lipoprotein
MNPRTGWPADRLLSATVLAPDAATADALATALYVMGVEEGLLFCEARPELAAILVAPGPRAGEVQLHTTGLRPDGWREIPIDEPSGMTVTGVSPADNRE